ncbi:MAG: hypothetical protein ACRD2Z_03565 [Thermoanaerobaculia bacterium]
MQPVEEVVLTAPEDLPLQLDGDPVALSPPVPIRLHRQPLKLLLPAVPYSRRNVYRERTAAPPAASKSL